MKDINDNVAIAKEALDKLIKKSRVHFYKPIQIAEILYHHRLHIENIDLDNLESYRNPSKHWRDDVSDLLLGRVCNSSAKYQDDLFAETAVPTNVIKVLAEENNRTNGAVEAYIYKSFQARICQLSTALALCNEGTTQTFQIGEFINAFWKEPGLKRSLDKIYEISVYSLFTTLVEALQLRVEVSVNPANFAILCEFQDFAKAVMGIDVNQTASIQEAKIYRVGVTNAADRGLDMYSNWGPAIQIKHLSLDEELAQDIVENIASDRIVIVCRDIEKKVIVSLLTQIGWKCRIQSIITEQNLIEWYEKSLRTSKYSCSLGNKLLNTMRNEIKKEFPSIEKLPAFMVERKYDKISDNKWQL